MSGTLITAILLAGIQLDVCANDISVADRCAARQCNDAILVTKWQRDKNNESSLMVYKADYLEAEDLAASARQHFSNAVRIVVDGPANSVLLLCDSESHCEAIIVWLRSQDELSNRSIKSIIVAAKDVSYR